jgi:hypothetical protein
VTHAATWQQKLAADFPSLKTLDIFEIFSSTETYFPCLFYYLPVQQQVDLNHRYQSAKIDCLSFVCVPATSAAHYRLLFFFLLQLFTVLMKKTRIVKQSIYS